MANVKWGKSVSSPSEYFSNLATNDSFVIKSKASKGAVYRKVLFCHHGTSLVTEYMMEEETGKLFNPTLSAVEKVDVSVEISKSKPEIYK